MKTWILTHSKDGFSVKIVTKNFVWDLLTDVVSFLSHVVFRFIPMVPFPIFHKANEFCADNKSHFHMSFNWFGWSIGDFLCQTLESYLFDRLFRSEKIIVSFILAETDLIKFTGEDAKFIEECQDFDREYSNTSIPEESDK